MVDVLHVAHTCPRTPVPPPEPDGVRVLVYAHDANLAWVERELIHTRALVQIARTMRDLVAALVEDPPPRPQVLIADFDDMRAAELLELHTLRDRGWFGSVLAIGDVSLALTRSLRIERTFSAPLPPNALRSMLTTMDHERQTVRMPRIVVSG